MAISGGAAEYARYRDDWRVIKMGRPSRGLLTIGLKAPYSLGPRVPVALTESRSAIVSINVYAIERCRGARGRRHTRRRAYGAS